MNRPSAHPERLDALIGAAVTAIPDAAFFATADHGMNGKNPVYDLNQAPTNCGAPVRLALSAGKDRYVRHHRTFDGAAWVWLDRPGDEDSMIAAPRSLPGVKTVLPEDKISHPDTAHMAASTRRQFP